MEPTKPKVPKAAVQLYNEFIHGGMSRRDFVSRVQQFAVGGLTAAAIVQALMPNYALGQQVRTNDNRIKASYETIPSNSAGICSSHHRFHRFLQPSIIESMQFYRDANSGLFHENSKVLIAPGNEDKCGQRRDSPMFDPEA